MRKGAPSVNPSGRSSRSDAATQVNDAGWTNLLTGQGVVGIDKRMSSTIYYEPTPPQAGLEYWLADDLAARIVEELPDEALNEGFQIKIGEDKSAQELMPPKPKAEIPKDPVSAPKEEASSDTEGAAPGVVVNVHAPAPKKAKRGDADYAPELDAADEEAAGESSEDDKPAEAPDLGEWLDERLKKLEVTKKLGDAGKLERACNGAAILLGAVDNRTVDQPLDLNTVRSFDWMTVIEAQEMSPASWYANPAEDKFGQVETWAITTVSPGPGRSGSEQYAPGGRIVVHETRLIVFAGIKVSRYQKCLLSGFGDNVFSRIFAVLRDFNNAYGSAGVLVNDFSQAVWAIKGLAQLLANDGAKRFRDRVTAMELARSTLKATVVDAEGESFARVATPVTGLPELLDRFERRLAAAAGMPITKLMGMSPGGLNATGESDVKNWNKRVKTYQVTRLQPALERIIEILIKVSGQKADTWCVEWRDLETLTELEQATLQKTVADTDVANIGAGIYTPEEAAVAHYSGDKFKPGIKLDFSARAMADRMEMQQQKQAQELEVAKANGAPPGIGGPPKPGGGKPPAFKADGFDPDQPRDEHGRWGEGGGAASVRAEINKETANHEGYKAIDKAKAAGHENPYTPGTEVATAVLQRENERDEKVLAQIRAGNVKAPPSQHLKAHLENVRAVTRELGPKLQVMVDDRVAMAADIATLRSAFDMAASYDEEGDSFDEELLPSGSLGEQHVPIVAAFIRQAQHIAGGSDPREGELKRISDAIRDDMNVTETEYEPDPDAGDAETELAAATVVHETSSRLIDRLKAAHANAAVAAKESKAALKKLDKSYDAAWDEAPEDMDVESLLAVNEDHPAYDAAFEAAETVAATAYEDRISALGGSFDETYEEPLGDLHEYVKNLKSTLTDVTRLNAQASKVVKSVQLRIKREREREQDAFNPDKPTEIGERYAADLTESEKASLQRRDEVAE